AVNAPALRHHVAPPVVTAVDDETDRPVKADRPQKGFSRLWTKAAVARAMKVGNATIGIAGSTAAVAVAAAHDPIVAVSNNSPLRHVTRLRRVRLQRKRLRRG